MVIDLIEGDAVEENFHIFNRVNCHAGFANITLNTSMV
jgi:hypothetical protein